MFLFFFFPFFQIPLREKVVAAEEASNRVGTETRLEGILGVLEGHHSALLPLRFTRGPVGGGGAKAFNHCRRRDHAAHSRASEA